MICSSPTPHASKLASTEKPDFVVLLLLLDVVAVRVGVVVAAAAACAAAASCTAAAVSAPVINSGVVSLLLLEFIGCCCCCSCQCCCSCFCLLKRALRFYGCVTRLYFACCTLHTHTPLANSMTPRVFAAGVCRQSLFIFSLNCQKKSSSCRAQATAAAEEAAKTRPAPLAESDWETASGVAQRRAEAKAATKAAELRDATTSRTREGNWAAR